MACEAPTAVNLVWSLETGRFYVRWEYPNPDDVLEFRVWLERFTAEKVTDQWTQVQKARAFPKARKYTFRKIGVGPGEKYRGCVRAVCKDCESSVEVCDEHEFPPS